MVQNASGTISDFPKQVLVNTLNATTNIGFGTLNISDAAAAQNIFVFTVNSMEAELDVILPETPTGSSLPEYFFRHIHVSPEINAPERRYPTDDNPVNIFNSQSMLDTLTLENAIVILHNVTSITELQGDIKTTLTMQDLERISVFKISEDDYADSRASRFLAWYTFPSLQTIGNLTIPSPKQIHINSPQFSIDDTLDIGGSGHRDDSNMHEEPEYLGEVMTIGGNLLIHNVSDTDFIFDELTSVRDSIVIYGVTNCKFEFGKLTELTHLAMYDFDETSMPGDFFRLEEADTIHLNGIIDTSNIFPSLKRVTGTVTVEPWNEDFNCSNLAQMYQDGIINELRCNGTNNGTISDVGVNNNSPTANGTPTLSPGAWAGIGIALGLVVAGTVGAIVWFVLRKRRAARPISTPISTPTPPPPTGPQASSNKDAGKSQLEGTAVGELGAKTPIREKADDRENDLNAVNAATYDGPPVELEGSPHRPK